MLLPVQQGRRNVQEALDGHLLQTLERIAGSRAFSYRDLMKIGAEVQLRNSPGTCQMAAQSHADGAYLFGEILLHAVPAPAQTAPELASILQTYRVWLAHTSIDWFGSIVYRSVVHAAFRFILIEKEG